MSMPQYPPTAPPADPQTQMLQQQVYSLQQENQKLRNELARIQEQAALAREARSQLLRGTGRLLIPLLDRQRVVRNFSKLAHTTAQFAGPTSQWPTRDDILADAREFLESCVRFTIRRRTLMLLFSLIAATVPAIQIWLVVKQNEIIENQTSLSEIQVYDIVSRSMTEGDRNARQMTGVLLANAKLEFLKGVIEETFDPSLLGVYRADSVNAAQRRLEDAAYRGHLIRAVVRGVEQRGRKGTATPDMLYDLARPMFRQILIDGVERVPKVLQLGGRQSGQVDEATAEQVDNYLVQIGSLLTVYGRLARTVESQETYFKDIKPLFQNLPGQSGSQVTQSNLDQNQFAPAYRTAMQEFLFDLALAKGFGESAVNLAASNITPEEALAKGIERLRAGLGEDALSWEIFKQQVAL